MSITGNLKTMQLPDLLQWASTGGKTGTLIIDNGQVQKRIFFEAGKIISSASTDPEEHLGHFLVSRGFIGEDELAKAMEMQASSKMMLGKILVTLGAISEQDLNNLLRVKAEESICGLFTWPEGEFRFIDNKLPDHAMLPMRLDVTAVVLEGARRQDEWQKLRDNIPSNDCIPVAMGELLDDSELDSGACQILELVDDDRTVEEIRLQTHSTLFHVFRVLSQQVERSRLKMIRPRPAPAATGTGAKPPPEADDEVDARALVGRARTHLEHSEYESALRALRAARSLEPDNAHVRQAHLAAEAQIRKDLTQAGIVPEAVPLLQCELHDLTNAPITPQQGFILTRIDGSYDIQSIAKISPMSEVETLLVFWKLADSGYIKLKT
jgi:hypothetical protein